MKYFNISNWQDPDPTPTEIYQQYIDGVRDKLPPDLQRLCSYWTAEGEKAVYLNDGRIRSIQVMPEAASAEVVMDGELPGRIEVLVHLRYGQVASFQSFVDPAGGLPGPYGYGDHGADEIEVREDGLLEHRMLFSSGIELSIVFRRFQLQTEPFMA